MITVLLHKTDDLPWTEEELSPIKFIQLMEMTPSFSPLGARITLANNQIRDIDFVNIDGNRTC